MALKFTTTDQASLSQGVKCLVYGDAGMGKTTLCATLPTPVILSAESGLLSLRKHSLPVIQIDNVTDLQEAYAWVAGSAEARQFQSVALDSLTEIAEQVLNNAKRQVKDPRQAYGELIEKMESVIRLFRDLPGKNVYMSAKMEPMKDELTGIVTYGPSMPGAKLGPKLPYFFDFVFRLGVNQTQDGQKYRFLQTQPELKYIAKDRSGALDAIEPPDLNHVIAKVRTN
jgi:phage nucleotide-binding protein